MTLCSCGSSALPVAHSMTHPRWSSEGIEPSRFAHGLYSQASLAGIGGQARVGFQRRTAVSSSLPWPLGSARMSLRRSASVVAYQGTRQSRCVLKSKAAQGDVSANRLKTIAGISGCFLSGGNSLQRFHICFKLGVTPATDVSSSKAFPPSVNNYVFKWVKSLSATSPDHAGLPCAAFRLRSLCPAAGTRNQFHGSCR